MKRVLLALIRFYRKYISPAFPGKCRFIPTCSEYGLEAIEKYGALRGGWLTFKRLLRCNPFNHGDFTIPCRDHPADLRPPVPSGRRARPRGGLSWILSAFPLAMCWNSSMDS